MRRGVFTIYIVVFTLVGLGAERCYAVDNQVMAGIQKLLTDADDTRVKLDKDLAQAINDMEATEVPSGKTYLLETSLLNHEAKINLMKDRLAQNHMVIEFLNAFISALYTAKDARVDAPAILGEMAHKELLNSVETGQDSKLWHFEVNLGIAIKNFMEPSEKFADFLKLFMGEPANLDRPGGLTEFFEKRKYINGKDKDSLSNPVED
jgi:hypothetical protein